jgi:hypothetical protein
MPRKFNESRRHKIRTARYRVTNWPEYDAALIRRGSLTVWLTEAAVAAWHATPSGERGGHPTYSAVATETGTPAAGRNPGGETVMMWKPGLSCWPLRWR